MGRYDHNTDVSRLGKDGKRLHPTPSRLYRVPKEVVKVSKPKHGNIEANYHGSVCDFKSNIRNTQSVYNDPKWRDTSRGGGLRDTAERSQEQRERSKDGRGGEGVTVTTLLNPVGSRVPLLIALPGTVSHCNCLAFQGLGRRPAHLFDMEVKARSHRCTALRHPHLRP